MIFLFIPCFTLTTQYRAVCMKSKEYTGIKEYMKGMHQITRDKSRITRDKSRITSQKSTYL